MLDNRNIFGFDRFDTNSNSESQISSKQNIPEIVWAILKNRDQIPQEIDYVIESHIRKVHSSMGYTTSAPPGLGYPRKNDVFDNELFPVCIPGERPRSRYDINNNPVSFPDKLSNWENNRYDDISPADIFRQQDRADRSPSLPIGEDIFGRKSKNSPTWGGDFPGSDSVIDTFASLNLNDKPSYKINVSEEFGTTPESERVIEEHINKLGLGPTGRPHWMNYHQYHNDNIDSGISGNSGPDVFALAAQEAALEEQSKQLEESYQNDRGYGYKDRTYRNPEPHFPNDSFQEWNVSKNMQNNNNFDRRYDDYDRYGYQNQQRDTWGQSNSRNNYSNFY